MTKKFDKYYHSLIKEYKEDIVKEKCWKGYERDYSKKEYTKGSCKKIKEAKKGARCTKVTQKASSPLKSKKWTKCDRQSDGSIKRVHWGDPNAKVTGKSGNTKRKKGFRKRHKCSTAKKGTPRYNACKSW